ncbi:MAG: NAD(P)H-quinone oxidoreductase subunit 2, chloroplastic [Phycisphaerae bacterium]|nr:NAD(P)H-quinone oxidoreductase subunit 2, chloroplastic [Phycisphaerae bacterium]
MINILGQVAEGQIWQPTLTELSYFAPELVLVATLLLLLIGPLIAGRGSGATLVMVVVGMVAAVVANLLVMNQVVTGPVSGLAPAAGHMLLVDNFSIFFKFFLLLFLLGVTVLWMVGSAATERNAPEFYILLLGSMLGMSLMVSTMNLLLMVMAIELASLPSYALVAFDKRNRPGAEAAIKYVIFGGTCAAIMMYGVSLLFGVFGTLDFTRIAPQLVEIFENLAQVPASKLALLGLALLAMGAGIAFKISAVPFHFWCPDVFQGAKIEVTTWLSVASKAAGLCLLLRLLQVLAGSAHASGHGFSAAFYLQVVTGVVAVVAAVTCLLGNLAAYRQQSVKRLLAYSSIAHAGYMLMLGAIVLTGDVTQLVWQTVVIYLVMYLLMNLGAFGATALVIGQTGSDQLENFTGLGRRAPALAAGLAICLFSLVGIPPLGGFIAKWWLLWALGQAAMQQMHWWLWALLLWASFNTLLSLFYYLRVIRQMYLVNDDRPGLKVPAGGVVLINVCALLLLLSGTLLVNPIRQKVGRYTDHIFGQSPASIVQVNQPQNISGNQLDGRSRERIDTQ